MSDYLLRDKHPMAWSGYWWPMFRATIATIT